MSTLRLLTCAALCGLGILCLRPATGQEREPTPAPEPSAAPTPTPPQATPSPRAAPPAESPPRAGVDPFRSIGRRTGSLQRLPRIRVQGLVRLRGKEPLALLELEGSSRIVRRGDRLMVSVEVQTRRERIALEVISIGRSGVRLRHAETGEELDLQ